MKQEQISKMADQYHRDQAIVEREPAVGSPKADRAMDRMERLCQRAEDAGALNEFLIACGVNRPR